MSFDFSFKLLVMLIDLKGIFVKKVQRAEHVWRIMDDILKNLQEFDRDKEHVYVIGLNRFNNVIYIDLVSVGSATCCIVDPTQVFRYAITRCAISIILVHNHPSGNVKPSDHDIAITQKLKEGAKLLDITLLDHVIVPSKGREFYSFQDEGLL